MVYINTLKNAIWGCRFITFFLNNFQRNKRIFEIFKKVFCSNDYSDQCMLIQIAEIVSAHASGKIASLITVESGHSIGTSLAVLRMFHRLGARSLTLTHNCNTPWYVSNIVRPLLI